MPKPLQITYSRTVSDGNYGNRKIEVVMEVEEGETEQEVLDAARAFVALNMSAPASDYNYSITPPTFHD